MKKISIILVLLLLFSFVVAICGYSAEKVYEVKISHIAESEDAINLGWEKFKEIIESKSNGRIKVKIFGNKILSNSNREDAEKVQNNIVQMTSVPTYTLGAIAGIKKYSICDFPYLFLNDDEIYKVFDGPIGKELGNTLLNKIGVKPYGAYSLGWLKLANNIRPIEKPEDLSGLKIRTVQSDFYMDLINDWGGSATPMAYGEVFTGLQQGTVDGMVTTTSLYITDRFYEVLKYMTDVNALSIVHVPIVNYSWYKKLPADLQNIFDESMTEYLPYVRQLEAEAEKNAIKELRERGLEVIELTDTQREFFIKKVEHIIEDKADYVGVDFLERVKKELGR